MNYKLQGGNKIWLQLLHENEQGEQRCALRQKRQCLPGAVGLVIVPGRILPEEGAELVSPICRCMTVDRKIESEIWYKGEYRVMDHNEVEKILQDHSCWSDSI